MLCALQVALLKGDRDNVLLAPLMCCMLLLCVLQVALLKGDRDDARFEAGGALRQAAHKCKMP
jgi:hypothetical protein